MESIFLILSGAILAAGVLYWFWSHIQLTQKKVQLLESAVFELRGLLAPSTSSSAPPPPPNPVAASPAPEEDEDWPAPVVTEEFKSTPLENLETEEEVKTVNLEDLQPGGGAKEGQDGFRELFIQHDPPAPVIPTLQAKPEAGPESLEAMPVRELRRLAEQRGLTNVSDMRKKELLAALRQQVGSVTVERTVELEEIEA
jgi:hypothetical protein